MNVRGPWRQALLDWSSGSQAMPADMLRELYGYATGLTVMQRLESRHSLLKRFLSWRHRQMPATLSAALRRTENKDLESDHFQQMLPDLLGSIGDLDGGAWTCRTDFLERVSRNSACAMHDALGDERAEKSAFQERLAEAAGHIRTNDENLPLIREHVNETFVGAKCYAVKGYHAPGAWTLFRILSTNPGQIVYLQRACYLSTDATCLV